MLLLTNRLVTNAKWYCVVVAVLPHKSIYERAIVIFFNPKSDGITREFNLNLLPRINDALGGHFDLNSFHHHGSYNVHSQAMESYLISSKKQRVFIEARGYFLNCLWHV